MTTNAFIAGVIAGFICSLLINVFINLAASLLEALIRIQAIILKRLWNVVKIALAVTVILLALWGLAGINFVRGQNEPTITQ